MERAYIKWDISTAVCDIVYYIHIHIHWHDLKWHSAHPVTQSIRDSSREPTGTRKAGNVCFRIFHVSCRTQPLVVPFESSLYLEFSNFAWDVVSFQAYRCQYSNMHWASKQHDWPISTKLFHGNMRNVLRGRETVVTWDCPHGWEQTLQF